MKKSIVTLALFFPLFFAAFASYSVYFFNGTIEVLEKDKPAHIITKINETFNEGDSLKIYDNAEVIIKDASGRFAIIHKAGIYTTARLKDEITTQQGKGLVASLASFLGSEFTKDHSDIRKMSESYMKQNGGVTRSGNVYPLMVWPPYGSVTDSNQVKFIWNSSPKAKKYEFVVFGGEDANNLVELGKSTETDTFMDVNFKDFGIKDDAYFSWVVYPEGDQNYSRYTFKISTRENTRKMVEEVEQTAASETNAEDKLLIKALAYEKKGLISYADKTYKALLAINNKNSYTELYTLFRLRNGLI